LSGKPPAPRIADVTPLSAEKKLRGARACNLCGAPAGVGALRLFRECDERDQPLPGNHVLLFVGGDHPACMARVDQHPWLYFEIRGAPGLFPKLCGGCIHRQGFNCTHPKASINGGPGLTLRFNPIAAMVVCIRGKGCQRPLVHVLECEGQELQGEREAMASGAVP
jgi:hypothetical protein